MKTIVIAIGLGMLNSCNVFPNSNKANDDSSCTDSFVTDSVFVSYDTIAKAVLLGNAYVQEDSIGIAFNSLVMSMSNNFKVLEQDSTYSYLELVDTLNHFSLLPKTMIEACDFPDTIIVKTASTKKSDFISTNKHSYTISGSGLDVTYYNASMNEVGSYSEHHYRTDHGEQLSCSIGDSLKIIARNDIYTFISYYRTVTRLTCFWIL